MKNSILKTAFILLLAILLFEACGIYIVSFEAPREANAGETITVKTRIKTVIDTIPDLFVFYYLSNDAFLDREDQLLLKSNHVGADLVTSSYFDSQVDLEIPEDQLSGQYFLIANAVSFNTNLPFVDEERQNLFVRPIEINGIDPNLPDLVATNVLIIEPGSNANYYQFKSINPGQDIQISFTTQNIGTTTANAHATHFYLSSTTDLEGQLDELGVINFDAMPPQTKEERTVNLTLPQSIPWYGNYYIIVSVDHFNEVEEYKEDNFAVRFFNVPSPNFIVTSFTAPDIMTTNTSFNIDFEIRNNNFPLFLTPPARVYLSDDESYSNDDLLLEEFDIPSIGAGTNTVYNSSGSIEIPDDINTGLYHLIFRSTYGDYMSSCLFVINTSGFPNQDPCDVVEQVVSENALYTTQKNSAVVLERKQHLDVQVYPNPATNRVSCNLSTEEPLKEVHISIMDMNGKVLRTKFFNEVPKGTYSKNFDIKGFPVGTYLIKLNTDKQLITKKLIVK